MVSQQLVIQYCAFPGGQIKRYLLERISIARVNVSDEGII
jgi:hypothetical protein